MEPLKLTCTTKVKANSVKQEYEKQDELKRSVSVGSFDLLALKLYFTLCKKSVNTLFTR